MLITVSLWAVWFEFIATKRKARSEASTNQAKYFDIVPRAPQVI
jgi:hypothetical protein